VRTLYLKGQKENVFPSVLKVPREGPLVILVKARLTQGKAVGSEEGKDVDIVISCEEKLSRGFTAYDGT
jgi:hypothetical protein